MKLCARAAGVGLFAFSFVFAGVGCSSEPESNVDSELSETGATSQPIINGTSASAYSEAVLVEMGTSTRYQWICSGSVIAPRVVLTAGHCVVGRTNWRVTAPYASNQRVSSTTATTYDYKTTSDTVASNQHDIGLIFLPTPITLSQYPQLSNGKLADNSKVVSIGRIDDGRTSNAELFVSPELTLKDASRSGYPYDYLTNEVIQPGDSGGPVEVPGASPHKIVAVNSGAGEGTQVLARVDLIYSWIQDQIASHGGGGNTGSGGSDAGTSNPPPPPPPPQDAGGSNPTCGSNEREPNSVYTSANSLSGTLCGSLTATDQDWFTWSVASAGVNYNVNVTATGDAQLKMWKLVNGSYNLVANDSPTEISSRSGSAGSYVLAVWSPGGSAQSYSLTLTR